MPDDYHAFLALKAAGFKPPTGHARCHYCAFHTPTQGHRNGCPDGQDNE